ncbi:MAG: hypothetical protein R3B57_06960 [Phycisphaerales bacterium]
MSGHDGRESGLERRLRAEAPRAGGLDGRALASVMEEVGTSEPGGEHVRPRGWSVEIGAVVVILGVGLGGLLILASAEGDMGGSTAAVPPAARIGELSFGDLAPPAAPEGRALVDEGRRVLDDARSLRDALATRLASLERASGGVPRGG